MLVIGEKINTVRKRVHQAYKEKDSKYICNEAIRQVEAGADVIDVNVGINIDLDPINMAWAVKIIQITRVYLPLLIYEGIDAVFLDPLDRELKTNLRVANTLLNRDNYCLNYLNMFREERNKCKGYND